MADSINIHNSAKVGKNVIISGNVNIGAYTTIGHNSVIEGNINIGESNTISNNVTLLNNIEIGSNNQIFQNSVIGTAPQHKKFSNNFSGKISIGDENIFRECVTIHLPTIEDKTIIGNRNFIMAYSHVAHDCVLFDDITIGNQTNLGGHVTLFSNSNLGLNTTVHQFCQIGSYSMVSMGSTVTKDILPFALFAKNTHSTINIIGLQRNDISSKDIAKIKKIYTNFNPTNFESNDLWFEKLIQNFLKQSKRGFYTP